MDLVSTVSADAAKTSTAPEKTGDRSNATTSTESATRRTGTATVGDSDATKIDEERPVKDVRDKGNLPTIEYLCKTYKNCVFSDSWFEKKELYDFVSKNNPGPTILVNNSNRDLDFGGGGTNGAIRNFFWPDQKYIFYFIPRGGQPWHKWNSLAGGLHDLDAFRKGDCSEPCFTSKKWAERPRIRDGGVYYTPIPKERRSDTFVEGILQAVGPRNSTFSMGTAKADTQHRKSCAKIVGDITRRCLAFASDVNAKNIVFSGISTGIFAGGDRTFAAAMRGAMLCEFHDYLKRTKGGGTSIVIIGRDWDKALFQ